MGDNLIRIGAFSLPPSLPSNCSGVGWTAELGLGALELFSTLDLEKPDSAAAQQIRGRADELGIALPCLSVLADLSLEGEIERLEHYVDIAADIGGPMLHHTIYPSLQPAAVSVPFEPLLEALTPKVREVYDYAERRDVYCVYEEQGFQFNGCERFLRFLDKLDRPAGVVLDVGNIAFVGERPDQFAEVFSKRIVHVHLKNFWHQSTAEADSFVLPDGTHLVSAPICAGENSTAKALRILQRCGYRGWYMLECDPRAPAGEADNLWAAKNLIAGCSSLDENDR